MDILYLVIGFSAGLILWTYINTVRILWKINKLLKSVDKSLLAESEKMLYTIEDVQDVQKQMIERRAIINFIKKE